MSIVSVRAALETKLNGMTPAIATVWENIPYTPIAGTPYQQAWLLPATPDNPTLGDNFYREIGIFQITLMYPLQVGTATAADRAELIRTQFKRGTSIAFDDILNFDGVGNLDAIVIVRISHTPEISAGRVDGDRWHLPCKIQWFAETILK